MSGGLLSNFGIALVIVFSISALAIFAQLFYVCWRRRVFRRRTTSASGGADEAASCYYSSECVTAPSKELLYFFCVRPQLPLNRSSLTANSGGNEVNSNRKSDVEVMDIDIDDLLKIQGVFGPPRFLFTIKEEEREGTESPVMPKPFPAENIEVEEETVDVEKKRGGVLSLEEHLQSAEEDTAMVAVEIDDGSVDDEVAVEIDDGSVDDEVAPYSTPCDSPVYFTPSESPVHEVVNAASTVAV